uniref:Bromo domain-containing protein n=1 Tax=Peronospora matthiolae TaxID=2874970 RepID=A0AAV1T1B0_9STRA
MPMPPDVHAKVARLHADLTRHSLAWPFLEPVDPVALNVPTYYDVISQPMDLATMGHKLQTNDYNDPLEYRAHLVLMFENAIEFNQSDERENSVAAVAHAFQSVALDEWASLFSETATTDWALTAEKQAQWRLMEKAKESRVVRRWKRDAFVMRLNRDKLDARRRSDEANEGE